MYFLSHAIFNHVIQFFFIKPGAFNHLILPSRPRPLNSGTVIRNYSTDLSHIDRHGNARMVDVSSKQSSHRTAVASGHIKLSQEAYCLINEPTISKKGSVLAVAQLAGIMAAKQTSNLIPLCHNIPLNSVDVTFNLCDGDYRVEVCVSVKSEGVTGCEMEALTATSLVLLTVYDMTKAVSKDHVISGIRLEEKSGGRSGEYNRSHDND